MKKKNINEKKYYSLSVINRVIDRKRFKSYIGWSFCKELDCDKYHQDLDFSLKKEKRTIIYILDKEKCIDKDKIIKELNSYEKGLNVLKSSCSNSDNIFSKSESIYDDINIISSNNSNNEKEEIITNIEKNNDKVINNNIIYINKNLVNNINNNVTFNNINIINNSINIIKKENKKENKKEKKNKQKNKNMNNLEENIQDDIYGNFDIVIPNVHKEKFIKMLEKNFYYNNKNNKYIVFKKDKLDKLPSSFHLLIETGLNVFIFNLEIKTKQIKKYISIINIRNKINNSKIKNEYIKDFEKRFSLNLNSDKNNIFKSFVYMIISNQWYSSLYQRFLDNKIYKCDYNNELEKVSLIAPDEFIFSGFVDYQKISEQEDIIKEQNDRITNLEKIVHQLQRQLSLEIPINSINKNKKGIIYNRKIIYFTLNNLLYGYILF